jgi:hypothetical protein
VFAVVVSTTENQSGPNGGISLFTCTPFVTHAASKEQRINLPRDNTRHSVISAANPTLTDSLYAVPITDTRPQRLSALFANAN